MIFFITIEVRWRARTLWRWLAFQITNGFCDDDYISIITRLISRNTSRKFHVTHFKLWYLNVFIKLFQNFNIVFILLPIFYNIYFFKLVNKLRILKLKYRVVVIYLCIHGKCNSWDHVTMTRDVLLFKVWRVCFPYHKSIVFTLARHKLSSQWPTH